MTTTIVFAETTDGDIDSINASYAGALSGGPAYAINAGGADMTVGQDTGFVVSQAFVDFDGSAVPSDELAVAAYVRLRQSGTPTGTGVSRNLELREFDWGASLTSADWRTPAQLSGLTLESLVSGANGASSNQYMRLGQETGVNSENSYVLNSSRNRTQSTPSGAEYNRISSADASGTSSDPALYYTTVLESDLCGVLGAHVQLSDGTHAFLELDADNFIDPTVLLRHHDGTSVTTIATVPTSAGSSINAFAGNVEGAQSLTLVTDASDNLYVLGRRSDGIGAPGRNVLALKAYAKGVGHTWTGVTYSGSAITSTSMPSYGIVSSSFSGVVINNVVAAWHNEGTGGTIVAIISHQAAANTGTDIAYALIDCNYLLTGSGSLLHASGDARGVLVDSDTESGNFNVFTNETGTLLDVAAAPGTTNRGFVVSASRWQGDLGGVGTVSIARYQLASGGASFADTDADRIGLEFLRKDANAKARVIGISTSQVVRVVVDPTSDWGIVVSHLQNIGTSSTFTELSQVRLDSEGITSMPSATTLATANNWETVYDPNANKVYVYYFDTADDQRLMRTGVDLNTGLADQSEVEVNSSVGASGSTNHAIRAHRGEIQGDQVLISIANETSGGTHSTIYVTDSLNAPPTAPTLTPEPNFDATTEQTFEWTFNDPNTGDTQSAYQLQINTSGGASAVNTGKVAATASNHVLAASSLANPGDWQWRVKTWDSQDEEGSYSSFDTFSTSASGTVTIIDPAMDNPAGVITAEYTIEWMVSGTTQDDYRVTMTRTDTETEVLDTDWVNSSDTTYEVTNMLSGVEYRIEVTVRNSSDVETNTDSVLITPDYDSPEVPSISVTANDTDGYILVTVSNPEPTGDKPDTDHNDILRRVSGSAGKYLKLGECDKNGTFRDYEAASGITYEYLARAQSEPSS